MFSHSKTTFPREDSVCKDTSVGPLECKSLREFLFDHSLSSEIRSLFRGKEGTNKRSEEETRSVFF